MVEGQKISVLILAYNRPKLVEKLLSELPSEKISKIYVSIDGPRTKDDAEAASAILSSIECKLKGTPVVVRHLKQNLGCRLGVLSGLDWFFNEVADGGLVLEDDCFPLPGLFDFIIKNSHEVNQEDVGMICAHNPFGKVELENYKSRFVFIYGWYMSSKTWKSLRKNIFDLKWPSRFKNTNHPRKLKEAIYWWATYARARIGIHDTWDSLFYRSFSENGFSSILPTENLIKNLGFGGNATHTKDPNGSILVKNGPNLAKGKFSSVELDDALADTYFQIKSTHIITPFYKVLRDMLIIRKLPDFDFQLSQSDSTIYRIDK